MPLSGIAFYKNRHSPVAVNRLLETHFPTLFYIASTLSAPSGHLPLEGKAKETLIQSQNQYFPKYTPRRFIIFAPHHHF